MRTRKKSTAMQFLEGIAGAELTLGGLISSIRIGEGQSQAVFAEKLGVSKSHLCDIEKGRKTLSPARAAKFARLLGYSETQFVRLALQDQCKEAGLRFTVHVDAA